MCKCKESYNLSVTQILDKFLPYTKEEQRCGIKKREKIRLRTEMAFKIQAYLEGEETDLSQNIKVLLNGRKKSMV